MTTPNKTSAIPEGDTVFTDQDWEEATDAVNETRARVLGTNPVAARAEQQAYDKIAGRVETLAALRKARGLTQVQMAKILQLSQAEVSRAERRSNLHLDTLSRFVEATGGQLKITAIYNDTEIELGVNDLLQPAE